MTLESAQRQLILLQKMKSRPENFKELERMALADLEVAFLRERQTSLFPTEVKTDFTLF